MLSSVNINVDLVILLVMTILVVRVVKVNYVTHLHRGIKFFLPRYYESADSSRASQSDKDIPIEEAVSRLNFTMAEIDSTKTSEVILSSQQCYNLYLTITQLLVIVASSLALSKVWHCIVPYSSYALWIPMAILLGFTFALNSLLITAEGQLAIPFFMSSFLIFLGLVHFFPHIIISADSLDGLAAHTKAIVIQLSKHMPDFSRHTMIMANKLLICIGLSFVVAAFATPARRCGQLIVKMTTGRVFEKVSLYWRVLLWADYTLTLPTAFLFSSVAEKAMYAYCLEKDVCSARTISNKYKLTLLRYIAILLYIVCKGTVYKRFIQGFLDYSVETMTFSLVSKDMIMVNKFKTTIKERSYFLLTIATQTAALPEMLFSLLMMMLRSTPHCTGVCSAIRAAANISHSEINEVLKEHYLHNTTQIAFEQAGRVFLDQAFAETVVGGLGRFPNPAKEQKVASLGEFMATMGRVYYLPAGVWEDTLNNAMFWVLMTWFVLYTLFIMRWLLDMNEMKKAFSYVI